MKKRLMLSMVLIWLSVFVNAQNTIDESVVEKEYEKSSEYTYLPNTSFLPGESIEFKATFGWFTVGRASLKVNSKVQIKNGRPTYKIDAVGKTVGPVDWLVKVDDYWGAFIDTSSMISHEAVRILKEGNYKKHEITQFNHVADTVAVKAYSYKRSKWTEWKGFQTPNDVRDMLSGYFYLRNIDFKLKSKGDTIKMYGFLEDTIYDLSVIYAGKEKVRTKAGIFSALKIIPIMPENSIFDGSNSVVAWISDDENKIPLKVSAKMFVGHAGVEITGFKNLRHEPNILK